MSVRDLQWLRDEVGRIVNFNTGQTSQDFVGTADDAYANIDPAINEAYDVELEEAYSEGDEEWFREVDDSIVWPASQLVLTLPNYLAEADILAVYDITSIETGEPIWISSQSEHYTPEVFPLDTRRWQWGTDGPGQATTLRIIYLPAANELSVSSDEPRYIPPRYRWVLVYTAAILLRERADEQAPVAWVRHRDEWRVRFHLNIFNGRPRSTNRTRIPLVGDVYS